MMKISLPEYIGGESIDTFLKFLREFLVYLINYNLMKPEADSHRVSLLGSAVKEGTMVVPTYNPPECRRRLDI
jgi:hypothetical protein